MAFCSKTLILYYNIVSQQKLLALSLALILGGALGNLYDRAVYGYVVDFIDWHVNGYHWPAFNIADAGISCGAVLLILDTFINPEPKAKDKAPNSKEEGAN